MRTLLLALGAATLLLAAGCAPATAEAKGKVVDGEYVGQDGKLLCPVMNKPVASREAATDVITHNGVKYYTCCAACKPAFEKEPEKYAAVAAK